METHKNPQKYEPPKDSLPLDLPQPQQYTQSGLAATMGGPASKTPKTLETKVQ